MSEWRVSFEGKAPDDDTRAKFVSEVLKLTALYGVEVNALKYQPHPFLRVLPGGDPKDAA